MPDTFKIYANLEQRATDYYLNTFPVFVSDDTAAVSSAGQKSFYNLIEGLYQLAFDEHRNYMKIDRRRLADNLISF
ncbi:MAG: hypothetical protein A2Y17_04945 [Clostridiales bacterium GWF2_38_85]|nr:MAG: hypothetical protein A2Y17_04945 [Clostridiales bacterium GWF2_38_85]HBL84365.1 hypothetical protein [Clostridiales bacterium]